MSMASWVTKVAEELVAPCEPTPCSTLPLSSINHALGLAFMVEMISVYPNNNREHHRHGVSLQPAKVIREALAKAFVPYYPVAGRQAALSPPVPAASWRWFATARAYVGIKFNHLVSNGIGVGQFLKVTGEIDCGQTHPSMDPISWYRETILGPPMLSKSLSPPTAKFDIVNSMYDFSIQTIKRLKEQVAKETSNQFTTFEVVAAILWKCRTQAINVIGDVSLSFAVSVRHLLDQLPKASYYGNCVYPLTITATAEQIMKASLAELARFIKDAKESLPTKFKEWASGNFKGDPYKISIRYNDLILSDWRWIEFYETDYGWGIPNSISPKTQNFPFVTGIILK